MRVEVVTADIAEAVYNRRDQASGKLFSDVVTLPREGVTYLRCNGCIGMAHAAPWPGLIQMHHACPRETWGGGAEEACRAMLEWTWLRFNPVRIIGWTIESNRLALAFARRLGFVEDGRFPTPHGNVIMQGWTHGH